MKYLFSLVLAIISFSVSAQKPDCYNRKIMNDLSADQIATLQTKRLAIALDLNESQKKQILELHKKSASERKKNMEKMRSAKAESRNMTPEERFIIMDDRLNRQLVVQKDMKKILSEKQYEAWKEMRMHKNNRACKRDNMQRSPGKPRKPSNTN